MLPGQPYLVVHKNFALLLSFRLRYADWRHHVQFGNTQFLLGVDLLFLL